MKTMLAVILSLIALSGCAHKDLKAPCANIVALTAGTVPCNQREPLNAALVPSTFTQ